MKKFSSTYQPEKNGRPKGKLNRSTLFAKWAEIETKQTNPLTNQVEGLTQDDIIILSLINKARKGDVAAIKEWLDNRFGKIKEVHEIETIDKSKELTKEELKREVEKMGFDFKLFDR
ncbi:MAG TPA: hypothetical protein PK079_26180 [Leptospiraceae bacterium]|nr:hypothetical protein [Leptospiraceae bacterium]HNA09500.1 hypothetical protein [Leptospiraceae bacterium]HNE56678.1 hypothetical protein [Leptospiraceae bacterium]HNF57441.1 hypothetical protein [Leptospiraceae bacterium]HNH57852.1 hypothetical protein [Leptospiraceae bacterium]